MSWFLAVLLGWLAGAWHLALTARRARSVGAGQLGWSVVLFPLAVAGPVGVVLTVARFSPEAVWAVVPGLWLAQLTLLGPLSRRVEVH